MEKERRKHDKPVPDNLDELLSVAQSRRLHQLEEFGWELKFVRRPLFQEPVAILSNPVGEIGVLNRQGTMSMDPVPFRDHDAAGLAGGAAI